MVCCSLGCKSYKVCNSTCLTKCEHWAVQTNWINLFLESKESNKQCNRKILPLLFHAHCIAHKYLIDLYIFHLAGKKGLALYSSWKPHFSFPRQIDNWITSHCKVCIIKNVPHSGAQILASRHALWTITTKVVRWFLQASARQKPVSKRPCSLFLVTTLLWSVFCCLLCCLMLCYNGTTILWEIIASKTLC